MFFWKTAILICEIQSLLGWRVTKKCSQILFSFGSCIQNPLGSEIWKGTCLSVWMDMILLMLLLLCRVHRCRCANFQTNFSSGIWDLCNQKHCIWTEKQEMTAMHFVFVFVYTCWLGASKQDFNTSAQNAQGTSKLFFLGKIWIRMGMNYDTDAERMGSIR